MSGKYSKTDIDVYTYKEIEISFDAIENKHTKKIPAEIEDRIKELHGLISINPMAVLEEVISLNDKYPNVPVLGNYLFNIYLMTDQLKEAETVAKENCKKHPDYIFAMVNLAQIYLTSGELNRIPGIFGHKYELVDLFPDRSVFHYTEFLSFMGIMSIYFHRIGDDQTAKQYYRQMKKIDKNHITTRNTKKAVNPGLIHRILRKLIGPRKASMLENELRKKDLNSRR